MVGRPGLEPATNGLLDPSHLRIDFRQFVGDDGSKVAGLRAPGSPAQILVRMWTKGRSRLAERYCAATAMVKADTSSGRDQRAQPSADGRERSGARRSELHGRPRFCAARRATAAGRSPGCGVALLGEGGVHDQTKLGFRLR